MVSSLVYFELKHEGIRRGYERYRFSIALAIVL